MQSLYQSKAAVEQTSRLYLYLLSSLFAALTAAGAFLRIPFPYVPFTLQPFFVILSGMLLGPKFGMLSQLIYVAVGLAGVPIFTNGGGLGYIFQPTFGYLLSFPVAAFVTGAVTLRVAKNSQQASLLRLCAAGGVGVLIILTIGATFLYFNLKFVIEKPLALRDIAIGYFVVFIPGDVLKIIASALTYKKLRTLNLNVVS